LKFDVKYERKILGFFVMKFDILAGEL